MTGSVARAGSFRGQALIVGVGTNVATLTTQLRLLGIFETEMKARKTNGERKVRHQSRVEKLARMPRVRQGRLLHDDRAWMDW